MALPRSRIVWYGVWCFSLCTHAASLEDSFTSVDYDWEDGRTGLEDEGLEKGGGDGSALEGKKKERMLSGPKKGGEGGIPDGKQTSEGANQRLWGLSPNL